MALLDRLLRALRKSGSKVLIFSQVRSYFSWRSSTEALIANSYTARCTRPV